MADPEVGGVKLWRGFEWRTVTQACAFLALFSVGVVPVNSVGSPLGGRPCGAKPVHGTLFLRAFLDFGRGK